MVYHLPLISFFLIALWVDALFYAIAVEDILSLVYIVSIFDFFLYHFNPYFCFGIDCCFVGVDYFGHVSLEKRHFSFFIQCTTRYDVGS